MNLSELREEIDRVDAALAPLFLRRMELSRQIAAVKAAQGLPIRVPAREAEVLDRVSAAAPEALKPSVRVLYAEILRLSRDYQAAVSAEPAFSPESSVKT